MQIAFHLGVHCTDDDLLLRCLLRNRAALAAAGVAVPGPTRYRKLLRDAMAALEGQTATDETAEMLLEAILEAGDGYGRLVMAHDSILAFPRWALGRGRFYPLAGERLAALVNLFPGHDCEVFLAIRNPATFLPALLEKQRDRSAADVLDGNNPFALAWSEMVERLRAAAPEVPLTLWCDEDTPLIWPEVLRAVAGTPEDLPLDEADGPIAAIMAPEGLARMRDYLATRPPQTVGQRRRIVSAFLDKYALPDRIDMVADLPGWTAETVEALTEAYEADVARIAAMPGVRFLAP